MPEVAGAARETANGQDELSNIVLRLKHNVERWCETFGPHKYVSNGAFIQAAIDLGYRYVQRGQVASFDIEPKSPGLFDWKHQQAVMSAGRAMQKQLANEIK